MKTQILTDTGLKVYDQEMKNFIDKKLEDKVDAEEGKGLSTNDYNDEEKNTVAQNKEDIEEIKRQMESYETENEDIVNTTESTLENSYEGGLVINELYGKTEQNAYTGKNLFTFPNVYYNGTGLNITKSTDGTYLLNGTSTGAELRFYDGYNSINKRLVVPNGTYKIVATINGEEITSTSTFAVITNGTTYASHYGTSFEITDGFAISSMAVNLTVGKNYTNSELKIMVCKQSEDNVWEPYIGGKPSPSPDCPQEIKSIKGKNLLDCRGLTEQTVNNVTFTPVYDSNGNLLYINANGTASAFTEYEVVLHTNPVTFASGNYIVNGCPNGGSESSYYIVVGSVTDGVTSRVSVDYGNSGTFELSDNTSIYLIIRVYTGIVCNNLKFYPMIRLASIKDDTYVPYGLLRIKTQGKNLLDMSVSEGTKAMSYNQNSNSYVQTSADTRTEFWLRISLFKEYSDATQSILVYENYTQTECVLTTTFTKKKGYNSLFIRHNGSTKDVGVYFNISHLKDGVTYYFKMNIVNATQGSIEFGEIIISETESDYIPYQSSEITLSETIELNGFNGVYDTVTSDGVTRRFAKVVFDGSDDENWVKHAGRNNTYWIHHSDKLKDGISLCSHYKETIPDKFVNYDYCYNNGDEIMIRDKDCNTLEEWKTKLQSNPITVVYELATPTTEELPIVDQIALHSIKTFNGTTYIETDSEIQPIFDVDYGCSQVGATSLESHNNIEINRIIASSLSPGNSITYELSKENNKIVLTGSDGSKTSVDDNDTVYTHPTSGVTAGTYRSVTVNANGHVTAGSNPTLTVSQGGTGATTVKGAEYNLLNNITDTTTELTDDSNIVFKYGAPNETKGVLLFKKAPLLWNYIKSKADSIYAKVSHGNHVPTTETANNAKFLRNDNTWQTVTPANIGAATDSHTHSSYANQNAFSNVTVGSTTISADTTTDTLTLVGSNVTLTPDATNDKVTIGITKDNVTNALGYTPPTTDTKYTHPTTSGNKHIPSGGSSGQILRWSADGTAVWGNDNNTVYTHPSYTARTGVPTSNQTPTFGGTFSVTQPVSDGTGHITAMNSRTITIPNSTATTSSAGLMSSSDKTKLDAITQTYIQSTQPSITVNGSIWIE